MSEPRQYTREECREMFLDEIRASVRYWLGEKSVPTAKEKLEGLAFSILVILDGGTGLPGMKVTPNPHEDDAEFHREQGENWWPDGVDIGGGLHEEFCR